MKNCEKENGGNSKSERGSTSSTMSASSASGSGSTSGSSAAILEQAFQHMTQMASHINEMKRKHEHAVRIQEIQSQLEDYVGEDLTRLGDLVLEVITHVILSCVKFIVAVQILYYMYQVWGPLLEMMTTLGLFSH